MTEPLDSTMQRYIERGQYALYKERFAHWRGVVGNMTMDEALVHLPGWEEVLGLNRLMHIIINQELYSENY